MPNIRWRFFSGPTAAVLFLVFLTTLILVNGEPWGAAAFHRQVPGKVIPDMVFSSTPDQVKGYFLAMGEAGRQAYLAMDNVDMVFPLAYSLAYFCIIGTGIRYLAGQKSPWRVLAWGSWIGGVLDYLENFCFRALALDPVHTPDGVAQTVSILTPLKYIFCSLGILGTLTILVWVLVRWIHNRFQASA